MSRVSDMFDITLLFRKLLPKNIPSLLTSLKDPYQMLLDLGTNQIFGRLIGAQNHYIWKTLFDILNIKTKFFLFNRLANIKNTYQSPICVSYWLIHLISCSYKLYLFYKFTILFYTTNEAILNSSSIYLFFYAIHLFFFYCFVMHLFNFYLYFSNRCI